MRAPVSVGCLMVIMSACGSPRPTPAAAAEPVLPGPVAPGAQALWGELKPLVSVKELMRDMLDPAADHIFDSVKVVIGKNGTKETIPRTDKDWDRIRIGAVTLAEGVYLLKIPRPFTPPGDENNSQGPGATELSPAQIKAKLERDPVLWNAKIEALRNVGLEVIEIVNKKNVGELWDAGSNLDEACESCHVQYWYPGDAAVLEKIDREIEQRHQQSLRGRPAGPGPQAEKAGKGR